MQTSVELRPITIQDEPFLAQVYASTRQQELQLVTWSADEKAAFLSMQFSAQHRYYQEQFKNAEFLLILSKGHPIGRLYIDRRSNEIRIIDIALLPAHRNQGIGSHLLQQILAEGKQMGLPVRIHVEHLNPALGLYQRLGFRQVDDQGVYFLMEWLPKSEECN